MSIYQDNAVTGRSGFSKEIDSKSTGILLDLTQENQYQFPVQSTIRELTSNAVDSVTEKFRALSILSGEKQVSDFFVEKDGDVYQDSRFDDTYYSVDHLSGSNRVRIQFEQRSQEHQRDLLRIMDEGVGLWGKRLEGYFKIG